MSEFKYRAGAVNLARNVLDGNPITPIGIDALCRAVLEMDRALAQQAEQDIADRAREALTSAAALPAGAAVVLVAKFDAVGKWLSAALDDPSVCKEMKDDINALFENVRRL